MVISTNYKSTLPINDGVGVGCAMIGQNFDFVSKGATLVVQG